MTAHASLLDAVFATTSDAVFVTDGSGHIERINKAFERLTGYTQEDLLGSAANELFFSGRADDAPDDLFANPDGLDLTDVQARTKTGNVHIHGLSISPIGRGDTVENFMAIVTKPVALERENGSLVGHDELTELPNRSLLSDRADQAILNASRDGKSIAMLVMGLDRFGVVNDALGYGAGDTLLRGIADRLKQVIRVSDTAARLDGDKFAVMTPISANDDSVIVAEKVLKATKEPFDIDGEEVVLSFSIGISIFPQDAQTSELMIADALSAMQHGKTRGGDQYQFFATEMNAKAKSRLDLEKRLRRALQEDEFLLYYQPKVDVETDRVKGAEALIRWMDPDEGMIGPGEFIPVAEETGLIGEIGNWALYAAAQQNKTWQDMGYEPVRMAVNVSPQQFRARDLYDRVVDVLKTTQLDPQWLELEITESMLMDNVEEAIARMQSFRDLGVGLSIDDFGTGYSSLSYLSRFPITTLKIDRAFIHDVQVNQNTAEIARAIIGLTHGLDLEVVAEGAELEEHVQFLKDHGCDTIQGFFYSRPLEASAFEAMLKSMGPTA